MNPVEKNAFAATKALLNFSQVPVTNMGLKQAFRQHTDFPSLNAISDVLTEMNVPNLATRLTHEQLNSIPLPALAHLGIEGGVFVPIRKIGETVEWLHTQRGWQYDTASEFIRKWSGITLLVETNTNSGEQNYTRNRRLEVLKLMRMSFIICSILLAGGLLWEQMLISFPFTKFQYYYFLVGVKLAGVLVSCLLIWSSFDGGNTLLQKVCRLNQRSDCQHILSSPAAQLTSWLNWSEVGLFYFAGGSIVLTIGLLQNNEYVLEVIGKSLYSLTILSLPFTVYSVYYQWKIARQWCILCLSIQLILWGEFFLSVSYYNFSPNYYLSISQFATWKVFLFSYIITPITWGLLKPNLKQSSQYQSIVNLYQKLKFDPLYIEGLLSRQRVLPPIFEGMKIISFGNPDAEFKLTIVTNPTCLACKRYFLGLKHLTKAESTSFYIQLILAVSADKNDLSKNVVQSILGLPDKKMLEALNRWFELGEANFEQWKAEINLTNSNDNSLDAISLNHRWLELAGVRQIPFVFLNNVEVPTLYEPDELPKLCSRFTNLGIGQFR